MPNSMRRKNNKIVLIILAAAVVMLPVRYALATTSMMLHHGNVEMEQSIDQATHHAAHAEMDMDAAETNVAKSNGACSCNSACGGSCSGCPHTNLGLTPVILSSMVSEHGIWLLTGSDSVGIISSVEISPPKPLSV